MPATGLSHSLSLSSRLCYPCSDDVNALSRISCKQEMKVTIDYKDTEWTDHRLYLTGYLCTACLHGSCILNLAQQHHTWWRYNNIIAAGERDQRDVLWQNVKIYLSDCYSYCPHMRREFQYIQIEDWWTLFSLSKMTYIIIWGGKNHYY